MFTELSLGCLLSRHNNLSTYQVSSSAVFFFVSYMHVYAPFIMYCSTLFVVVFQEMNCLNVTLFVGSQSFISLPSFMFVSDAVSELRKSNQNEKEKKNNSEIVYFQFNTFHIVYPFLNQRYRLSTCTHSIC